MMPITMRERLRVIVDSGGDARLTLRVNDRGRSHPSGGPLRAPPIGAE